MISGLERAVVAVVVTLPCRVADLRRLSTCGWAMFSVLPVTEQPREIP